MTLCVVLQAVALNTIEKAAAGIRSSEWWKDTMKDESRAPNDYHLVLGQIAIMTSAI